MKQQRGAAILTAMLTVVLVATLAASMLWQQWRGVEIETAQRARVQSAWILTGALDWARLILREDARQGGADHLAEPWAVPLAPARLSSFLAAEKGQALVGDDTDARQDAFLAGSIQDLQARLNVTNLLDNGKLHESTLKTWQRLFAYLSLPEQDLQTLTQALLTAAEPNNTNAPQVGKPLMPQDVNDLVWLGVPATTLQVIAPYVTVLPLRTTVNLNTAPAEVLQACVPGMDMARARELVQARASRQMDTLADAENLINATDVNLDANEHGIASRYFEITGRLRVGQATLQERSVVQRDGQVVKVLTRTREAAFDAATPLQ